MVTAKLKGIFKVRAKGRVYYYAWRGGPRIEAEFGTPEFLQEFLDARSPLAGLDRRKFGTWVSLYKASDQYRELSDSTKRNWGPLLDEIKDHFGMLSVRLFDRSAIRRDIRHWRDKRKATPRMADLAKQVLSRVCSFIVEEGSLSLNPCEGVPNLYSADRSEIIWTDDDLDALCKVASPEIAWAARLAALTGLRQGDLLRLPWSRIGDLSIEIKTRKSGGIRTALIPVTDSLRDLLTTIPKRSTTVLTNTRGRPWKTGFGASWQDAIKQAGLQGRDLHFHDLRGTFATNLYRAGYHSPEIAETLGWSQEHVEQLLNRYIKRDEIMRDRIRRLERLGNEKSKTDSKTEVTK